MVIYAYYSNRTEALYEELRNHLLASSPLTNRWIILPSQAMKNWLMKRLALDPSVGIAFGLQFLTLDQAFTKVLGTKFPNQYELALLIEKELSGIDELNHYLIHSSPHKANKRRTTLADELGSLFLKYGKYGGDLFIEWPPEAQWQKKIWDAIYADDEYPYRLVTQSGIHSVNAEIHFFALSYLPKLYFHFFEQLQTLKTNYYLLSPTSIFWSDQLSFHEGIRLLKHWKKRGLPIERQNELKKYINERNPLLANWGKIGREMAQLVEESSAITEEIYSLPNDSENDLSLLQFVQTDLLFGSIPDPTDRVNRTLDDSIQLHGATSKLREVQVIYNQLIELLAKHAADDLPIYPEDILIMTPSIEEYAPYIEAVFNKENSLLKATIGDGISPAHHEVHRAFALLLDLPFGRWDSSSIIKLFDSRCFQEKHELTTEQVAQIKIWIKNGNVRWGKNNIHRNAILKRDFCSSEMSENSSTGTWDEMISDYYKNSIETSNFDITQASLLGKSAYLLNSLYNDLNVLTEAKNRTLAEWSSYLRELLKAYFVHEQEDLNKFFLFLEQMDFKVGQEEYSFSTIQYHLKKMIERPYESQPEHQQSALFCAMLPMRAIPAKMIVLLGMNEGAYPRSEVPSPLNLLKGRGDYAPSQMDYDRYLFLETVLSARKYLVLSYLYLSEEDGKETPPSILISELFSYLDERIVFDDGPLSQKCYKKHSQFPFDKSYFQADSSYASPLMFKAAETFYNSPKYDHQFIADFSMAVQQTADHKEISIKELAAFARNPIRSYCQMHGIYLEKPEERLPKEEERFHLTALDHFKIKKTPANSFEELMDNVHGQLPIGPFKQININKIQHEWNLFDTHLSELGISRSDLFSIQFSEHVQQPLKQHNAWHLPIYRLEQFSISGSLNPLCSQGFLIEAKNQFSEIVKWWPEYLLFCCAVKRYDLPIEPVLILTKGEKLVRKEVQADCEQLLKHYLEYYVKAIETPSPLLPDWIKHLMTLEEMPFYQKVEASLKNSFQPSYNEYLKWAVSQKLLKAYEWKPTALKLFEDLYKECSR